MIKLFALDVDGTLTDGGIYLDGFGNEFKRFDVQDGYGLYALLEAGLKIVFISGRSSHATQQRADELKITRCINGTKDKLSDLMAIAQEWGLDQSEIAYAGDDIPDLKCIRWAGLGMATANAVKDVSDAADWKSARKGGNGAIRDCAEHILKVNGENL